MGAFLEERLPVDVRMGATYGDGFSVEITQTASGSEHRHLRHPHPQREITISYTQTAANLWDKVVALYYRAYGLFAGFRVRNMDDFSTNDHTGTPTAFDQQLTRIEAGVYQLVKYYGTDGTALDIGYPKRILYKPVAGTVKVAVNGAAVTENWSVDTTTGRVTFAVGHEPLEADIVSGGCEFDLPCRFNSRLDITHVSFAVRESGTIDIIELVAP